MKAFDYLIGNLIKEANKKQDTNIKKACLKFQKIIQNEKVIRIFVAGSNGSGHQTTTVHIMMRLIYAFEYSGNVEVYYEEKEKADKPTKEKLIQLILGLTNKNFDKYIKIGPKTEEATITFIEYDPNNKPENKVNYGFTGGADDKEENYAIKLNVSKFLRLQPLKWINAPNDIEYIQKDKIVLSELVDSPYYYRAIELDEKDWEKILEEEDKDTLERTKLEHTKNLYEELKKGDKSGIYVLPIYGIRDDGKMQLADMKNPAKYMYILLSSLIKLIENKTNNDKKIVVVSFGEIGEETVKKIESGCKEYLEDEIAKILNKITQYSKKDSRYKKYVNLSKIYKSLIKDNSNLLDKLDCVYVKKDTSIESQKLNDKSKVLYLQLGGVSTTVFNYFYSNSNLATVFEGQGTAPKAICFGKPYLQLGKVVAEHKYEYVKKYKKGRDYIIDALDGLLNAFPTEQDVEYEDIDMDYIKNKINNIYKFMLQIIDDKKSYVENYIKWIQKEYSSEKDDKLLKAIVSLMEQEEQKEKVDIKNDDKSFIINNNTPEEELIELLKRMNEKISPEQTVDLLEVLPIGYMKEFYENITINKQFLVQNIKISPNYNDDKQLTSIVITGVTDCFGIDTKIESLEFAIEPAGVKSMGRYSCVKSDTKWDIMGAPWIVLEKPGFDLNVFNYAKPVSGIIFGNLKSLGVQLTLQYPINTQWIIEGRFDKPYLTIAKMGQVLGGINIQQYLPEAVYTLVDLGIEKINITYDSVSKTISYISVVIKPNHDVSMQLIPNIDVNDLWIEFMVYNPIDLSNRHIEVDLGGTMDVGGGILTINANYPEYVISGNLTSGKIDINKFINIFLPDASIDIKTYISQMSLYLDIKKLNYGFSVTLDTDWQIEIASKPIFTITNLGLSVEGKGKQIPSVTISGSVDINQSKSEKVRINMLASYESDNKKWLIKGNSRGVFSLASMLNYYTQGIITLDADIQIENMDVEIHKGNNSTFFKCSAKTAYKWEVFSDLSLDATVEFGYRSKSLNLTTSCGNEIIMIDDMSDDSNGEGEWFGRISCETRWQSIDIIIGSEFDTGKKEWSLWFRWLCFYGSIKKMKVKGNDHWIGTLKISDFSFGNMIEEMISWATGQKFGLSEPWNLINSISLSNLELEYDFTGKKVSFNIAIAPIELGLAKIEGIGVAYDPDEKSVIVELKGSFRWMSDPDAPLSWDATDPDSAPVPPGSGNKYIDLRLLALGQHVSITGLNEVDKVQDAIDIIRELPELKRGQLPIGEPGQPVYDGKNSWLIVADFGLLKIEESEQKAGYVVQLSTIFHDSDLYALRIALAGNAAKVLKGLEFEIMYRKINDTVGCYSSEIKLPDTIRNISVGAYTITLPVLGVEIYTNGDFKIDIGFPWNFDFSRSFTLQGIVVIGPVPVPLLGSAGFYFGKLSQDTCKDVPKSSLGNFKPIHVFGIGLQFGLGKYIEKGIFRAGLSLTVAGILEGIIAKWNPIQPDSTGGSSSQQLQGDYYFWMQGTVGIIGKLFGLVDFSIVKAQVDVDLKITAGLTLASYADIPITVHASVDVALKVSINCGLFKIKIHFSFSMRIKETFTIKTDSGKPPWYDSQLSDMSDYHKKQVRRLKASTLGKLFYDRVSTQPFIINWSNLIDADVSTYMKSYIVPSLTMSIDGEKKDAEACYVPLMFIETIPEDSLCRGIQENEEMTSFEILCTYILRWVIAAAMQKKCTVEEIDDFVITSELINNIQQYLAGKYDSKGIFDPNNDSNEVLTPNDVEEFIKSQKLIFKVQTPSLLNNSEREGAIFPIPRKLGLDIKSYGNDSNIQYTFDDFSKIDDTYIEGLREYFDKLSVIVKEEDEKKYKDEMLNDEEGSLAGFIFSDYFLLIAKQMVQAALDSLRNFKLLIDDNMSINDIISWVNNNAKFSKQNEFTAEELLEGNENHLFNANKKLKIVGVKHIIKDGQSFNTITTDIYRRAFPVIELIVENRQRVGLFVSGSVIKYTRDSQTFNFEVTDSDTIESIAKNITEGDIDKLIRISDISTNNEILQAFADITLPTFLYTTVEGDCNSRITDKFNVSITVHPDNLEITDLFRKGTDNDGFLNIIHLNQFKTKEIIHEIHQTGAIKHLSGMVSRYLLHGLRLPTEMVNGGSIKLLDQTIKSGEYGLYKLTGQQFTVPESVIDINTNGENPYSINITKTKELDWVEFDSDPAKTYMTITLDVNDTNAISSVLSYGRKEGFSPANCSIGISSMIKYEPLMAPFSSVTLWNSSDEVNLPYGELQHNDSNQLKLWQIPESLQNLSVNRRKEGILPRFNIEIGTFNEATSVLDSEVCKCYGWGTKIDIAIRRIPTSNESLAANCTYELMGCSEKDIILLERIVGHIQDKEDYIDSLRFLYNYSSLTDENRVLISADTKDINYFISQVNLTTVTRPPSQSKSKVHSSIIEKNQTNISFLRQLWENSITRSGGYFLYYCNGKSKVGFPDNLFNDRGEGRITLLIMYNKLPEQNGMTDYMNCAITGDSIDQTKSVVYAKVNPVITSINPAGRSLIDIAGDYHTNPAKLAEDNSTVRLNNNSLTISNGTYTVKSNGPITVQDICNYFDIALEDLKKVNPKIIDWSDLSVGNVLQLPEIIIDVGSAKGGTTLESLAIFYGVSISQLAYVNKDVKSLFDDTNINIVSGPYSITSSVPAGTVVLEAKRQVPGEVPSMPESDKDYNYGKLYIEHMYNLLGFKIKENNWFSENPLGLPMGPTEKSDMDELDKIRMPRGIRQQGELWEYQQSIPYYKFYESEKDTNLDNEKNPYSGVGNLLQIDYYWVDLFGNKINANMDTSCITVDPSSSVIPSIMGYTDKLIPLSMWQGVNYKYTITKEKGLSIILDFDSASFNSLLVEDAKNAKIIYEKLYYQIKAYKGKARFSIQSSLLDIGPIPLEKTEILSDDSSITNIEEWIEKIYTYVRCLAQGRSDCGTCPNQLIIYYPFAAYEINSKPIFSLDVNFIMERDNQYVDSHFKDSSDVRKVVTSIQPEVIKNDSKGNDDSSYDLEQFAIEFEKTLCKENEYTIKLATGMSRERTALTGKIWAVKISANNNDGIHYEIMNTGKPVFFTPIPISNRLESRCDVPIYEYKTGSIIDFNKIDRRISFTDVDIDIWMKTFLTAVDDFLSPKYISSLGILTLYNGINYLDKLKKLKQNLAKSLSEMLYPVYGNCEDGREDAMTIFKQQLLQSLLSFYDTKVMIQFQANVTDIFDKETIATDKSLQLYGTFKNYNKDISSDVLLSDAKLNLGSNTDNEIRHLTFSLSSGDEKLKDKMTSNVLLDLDYQVTDIEHEISNVPGIEGYKASSWLSFVIKNDKDNKKPLSSSLGKFEVPIIYRAYPTPPSMVNQFNKHKYEESDDIRDACKWDYAFEYKKDYHYTQDATYFTIKYNISEEYSIEDNRGNRDLIDALAEFVMVYPAVSKDLEEYLCKINQTDCDKDLLEKAVIAVESFIILVEDVSRTWELKNYPTLCKENDCNDNCYKFYTKESSIDIINEDKTKVKALKITIIDEETRPVSIVEPIVEIDNYYTIKADEDNHVNYIFKSIKTGKYLTVDEGLGISKRIIRVPNINVLSIQNAVTSSYMIRNKELIEGRITNEAFIYQTPVVSFTNPYIPKIDIWKIIPVASIKTGRPIEQILKDHLQDMITSIANGQINELMIQLECKYSYSINSNLTSIELPVLLLPAKKLKIDYDIPNITDNILKWFMRNKPNVEAGALWFDLMVRSNLTEYPMPLLRLRRLMLEVKYIKDILDK
ncbi:hypothetical protein SH1V18_01550 [Vallitalea longa]|uniref:LysM domain-containing protein n=1 Tax=Vallitalea longa TaxID=2936439 RepID=A0A9W6DD77_9FIRM|nr:hypothetical protein [Vallitalea longa]GKX27675.1 hypothetical protein SH1V18_01550 [Vallitalea longa]